MNTLMACSNCGEQKVDLLRCGQCKSEFYCSKVCQKQHWKKGHKETCMAIICLGAIIKSMGACSYCGEQEVDLLRCGQCKSEFYCSKVCQKQHWKKGHKETCQAMSDQDIKAHKEVCCYCNKVSNHLKKCIGCKEVSYCSRDCQSKDWSLRHKHDCHWTQNKGEIKSKNNLTEVGRESVLCEKDATYEATKSSAEVCPICGLSCQLKSCQRCLKQKYCSTDCQKVDWKKHKKDCKTHEKETKIEDKEKQNSQPLAICAFCKKGNTSLACSGCKAIYYCSKSCSDLDWARHKLSCKSQNFQKRIIDTLSTSDCHKFGLVTPEEHRGRNKNDGYWIEPEGWRDLMNAALCCYCKKKKFRVECLECKTLMYCSVACRDLDKAKHFPICYFTQVHTHTKYLSGMSNMVGYGYDGNVGITNSPDHAKLPRDRNPLYVEDGADLNLVIERSIKAREIAVMKTLYKYPNLTLITRIRQIPVEERTMFGSNISTQPFVFLSYIRRFHPYRGRHNVYLQDSDRREIYVSFYLPNDDPTPHFRWSDVVPGKFIAILFPCIHFFVDKSVGLRVDKAKFVSFFDVDLSE